MTRKATLALLLLCSLCVVSCRPRRRPAPARRAAPERERVVALDEVVLSPKLRDIPGRIPSPVLRYHNPAATNVLIAGTWDRWTVKHPMQPDTPGDAAETVTVRSGAGYWSLDIRTVNAPLGRNEFKFLPDGEWEPGPNRLLYVNEEGVLEQPSDIVLTARIEERDRIDVHFRRAVDDTEAVDARIVPDLPIRSLEWSAGHDSRHLLGFVVAGDQVTFCMAESIYGIKLDEDDRVAVAGTFNGWNPGGDGGWMLERRSGEAVWEGTFPLEGMKPRKKGETIQFKFVVNDHRWLEPPLLAPNAEVDGEEHVNLTVDTRLSESPVLRIHTARPLVLSNAYQLVMRNVDVRPVYQTITPGAVLDRIQSTRPLGIQLDPGRKRTGFRLFAPRASAVDVCFYDRPAYRDPEAPEGVHEPVSTAPMTLDAQQGVWKTWVDGIRRGAFTAYRVTGPAGGGDAFSPGYPVGDPYSRAVVHESGNSIVIDRTAKTRWFERWTDSEWRTPAPEDVLIYEAHVRDLTMLSDAVPAGVRGKFEGILASEGTGMGLDHLEALGVNMIEFMPVHEFENAVTNHGWGYSPVYYFAPESSYAQAPEEGSQYYEFKRLVNELHRRGFGVILDVVYNHVGGPNIFSSIDSKYYFRMDHAFQYSNFSGCGNDVRTEATMMRRLIVDNVLYWMREHHVDGFRFDLAELIDMDTLMLIRDKARELNPNVLLISEPWSLRGDHKLALRGTGWSSWNNEFREAVKHFVRGEGSREDVKRAILGSVDSFAADPLQTVNYLESHDDRCLADDLTENPEHDGRNVTERDAARHRLAATVLFTSLGIPMLGEGQEWIRSKQGLHNTYDKGDAVNGLRWEQREEPARAETLAYYRELIRMRQSDPGQVFRRREPAPEGYYRWIEPPEEHALGYIVNGPASHPGGRFVVLLNPATEPVTFEVALPSGLWRLIGDGQTLDATGIVYKGKRRELESGTYKLPVPALSAYIFIAVE